MYEWKPYAESTPSDCEPSVSGRAVFGPPILSVAWIPYYANIDEIRLPTAVSNPRWKDAFQLMLRSGNSAPPFRFEGKSDVRGFLAVKNFRAALGLCDVKLETDRAGLAVRISFSFLQEVGCTAVRMNENPAVLRYVRGKAVTAEHPRIVWNREENLVEIVHEIKFRLSGLLAFAAKWKVGEWPAYAWIRNTYRIHASGSVSIWSAGSLIPSACSFVDWKPSGDHSMIENTEPEFEAFLFAGANVVAPGQIYWSGMPAHGTTPFGR